MVNQIIQTSDQAFYIFSLDYLYDMDGNLITFGSNDKIVAKNYYSVVGMSGKVYNTRAGKYNYVVVPVMGYDSSNHTTSGYCVMYDVPTFYVYRGVSTDRYHKRKIINDYAENIEQIELNLNIEPFVINEIQLVNFEKIETSLSTLNIDTTRPVLQKLAQNVPMMETIMNNKQFKNNKIQ